MENADMENIDRENADMENADMENADMQIMLIVFRKSFDCTLKLDIHTTLYLLNIL